MQYVNDDMDELFRRAAENYPLDASSADWNKVLSALQGQAQGKSISEKKRNKNSRLLWLLFLLPLGLICNQLYSPSVLNGKQVSKADAANRNATVETKTVQANADNSTTNSSNITDRKKIGNKKLDNKNQIKNSFEPAVQNSKTYHPSNFTFSKGNSENYPAKNKNSINANNQITIQPKEADGSITNEVNHSRKYLSEVLFVKALQNGVTTSVTKKLDPLISSPEQDQKSPIHTARRKRFYAGVVGGIDATTIKFQKVDNAGATYGALLGYQLNKKWSIETGIYLEKKYYYTEGKYFNASKIYPSMPSNYWIDDVSGNCKMIEVPVLLRYNFLPHINSGWFATVGTSSYFMKNESYSYDFYYGSPSSYRRHEIDTTNATKNLFSNLSVSAGYTHRLGNFADLRIEPYLKVPISGMGIGNLPLFSTGLQIGLTRKF